MNTVYQQKYVCLELVNNVCQAWQSTQIGAITPQLAGIMITYAFFLNLIVFGFKTIKRQF